MGNCASGSDAPFLQHSTSPSPHSPPFKGLKHRRSSTGIPNEHSPTPSSGPSPFASLPDEALIQIFARCPLSAFPSLRLVCKSWRELLQLSEEVTSARRENGKQEQWVVVVGSEGDQDPFRFRVRAFHCQSQSWHTIHVPKEVAQVGPGFAIAAQGHKLYVTGGSVGKTRIPSASVWCLDILSTGWEKKACMNVPRKFHAMGAINGVLVVAGGETDGPHDFCLSEIYDPATDTWHELENTAVPARSQEGWVVGSGLYVRQLPDQVYKIILPDSHGSKYPGSQGRLTDAASLLKEVKFQVSPYRRQVDPILAGMDYITSAEGRVYGCMRSRHLSSIGVFNRRSLAWHLLIGNSAEFHRIFERFDGMVCGGGCLFVITRDDALLQIVMEDRGQGLAGPEWFLLSKGNKKSARASWRRFACLEL